MAILQISFDFPDSIVSEKTKAVYNLVESQTCQPNIVVSLNRTANPFADFSVRKETNGYSMNVYGFPFGIGLKFWMYLINKRLDLLLSDKWEDITLIHAHKLTFEGIIGYFLSKKHYKPLIITVRGDSDLRVVKTKLLLRGFFKNVIHHANLLIFLAPWTRRSFKGLFSDSEIDGKSVIIPNIIEADRNKETFSHTPKNAFVSVLRLDSYKRKNIKRIIQAIDSLHVKYPEISLDIIGTGSKKSLKILKGYILKSKFPNNFKMVGKLSHDRVQDIYKNYAGLILPSKPETFGLVFIEALNAGIPIIYAEDSGVDGFFDGQSIGFCVPYESQEQIKLSIEKIFINQVYFFEQVEEFIDNGGLEIFSKKWVSSSYNRQIQSLSLDRKLNL